MEEEKTISTTAMSYGKVRKANAHTRDNPMNRTGGPDAHGGPLPQLSQQSGEMSPAEETPLWEGPKEEASGSHVSRPPLLGSLLPTSTG